ncbi:hypothetical protein BMS3Bbin06_00539 [bacterium BMS3Bbin06]|nr:hypothetical protein BMS3Bbin06_00539 [bacterium BMS3Bbin06]
MVSVYKIRLFVIPASEARRESFLKNDSTVLKPESGLFNKSWMSRTLSGYNKNKKWHFIHRLCL